MQSLWVLVVDVLCGFHMPTKKCGKPPGAQWQTEATLQDEKHHLDTDSRWLKDPYEPVISILFTKASKVLIGGVNIP